MTATTYNFRFGVSDGYVGIQPQNYVPAYPALKALNADFWRTEIPWGNVASTLRPGPYSGGGKTQVTATATGSGFVGTTTNTPHTNGTVTVQAQAIGVGVVIGVAPSAGGRDWSFIDGYINDVHRLSGMDILMVITQSMPGGWTPADFTEFCTECAIRYGPGGPGIRTDGIYAANAGWGVTHWEFWNEENCNAFWTSNVNAANFTALVQAGYTGIKQVQPGTASTCIIGGLQHVAFTGPWFGYGWITLDEFTFFRQCCDAGILNYCDAVAEHVYPNNDPGFYGNNINGAQLPCMAYPNSPSLISAFATGSGKVNIPSIPQHGRLQVSALGQGTGIISAFQPAGPVPDVRMDNFRQLQGIYALMQHYGHPEKKIWITELGYCVYDTTDGINATNQLTYTKACFDILNTLPYIDTVLLYNAVDTSNSTQYDGINGFGLIDATNTPRPIYYWALTLKPPIYGAGTSVVSATASGSGTLVGSASPTITALMPNTSRITFSGAYITFTAQGGGLAGAGDSGVPVIQATATGSGLVAVVGSGGGPGSPTNGGILITARATGVGKQGVQPSSNGDALVVSTAFGSGMVATTQTAAIPITVIFTSTYRLDTNGAEIGVVGEVTGGTATVTATATGASMVAEGDTGALSAAATITGAGTVGVIGAGALTESLSTPNGQYVGPVGAASVSVTAAAIGSGAVTLYGAGTSTVTATGSGSKYVVYTDMGAQVETATATGTAQVAAFGSGSETVTAAVVNSAQVGSYNRGASTVAAVATSTSTTTSFDSGSINVTALATGVGTVGVLAAGSLTITETGTGTTFSPYSVNTPQTNAAVPAGTYGCYVTLIGQGGGAGSGSKTTTSNAYRGPGGGGGGGGIITRSFIPVASLGSTYSLSGNNSAAPGGASISGTGTGNQGTFGTASVFSSGGITWSAGGGGGGGAGHTGNNSPTYGAGGTASATGYTPSGTVANGGNGAGSMFASVNGSDGTSGSAGGGGSGGGTSSTDIVYGGSNGGSSINQTGGAGAAAASDAAAPNTTATSAGQAGAGAGGGGADTDGTGSSAGGDALGYGGGGGGGGAAGRTGSGGVDNSGGDGGPGYFLVEWIAAPLMSSAAPSIYTTATTASVLGYIMGAAPAITVSITGTGFVAIAGGGSQTVTATGTGSGVDGESTTGQAASASATSTGTGSVGTFQTSTPLSVSAGIFGAGQIGAVGTGPLNISAGIFGAAFVGTATSASPAVTATATGAGFIADMTSGSLPATATATGTGAVLGSSSGTATATVTGTGTGVKGVMGTTTDTITATGTGTGIIGTSQTSAATATATATGTGGPLGVRGAGTPSITATATGAGAVTHLPPAYVTSTTAGGYSGYTTAGTASVNLAGGSGSNLYGLVFVDNRHGGFAYSSQTTTATWNGVNMTLLYGAGYASDCSVEVWGITSPPSASSTIAYSCSGGGNTGREISFVAIVYSGVSSVGTAISNTGSGTTPTITVSPSASQTTVAGAGGNANTGISASTGMTSRASVGSGGSYSEIVVGDCTNPTTSMNASTGNVAWLMAAVTLSG